MKTPDEIKKGLGEAIAEASWVVDDGDMHDLRDALDNARANMADALALIQQLEAERDAAVKDLKKAKRCMVCKHDQSCEMEDPCFSCLSCRGVNNFEWRGVQKEDSDA